jgi:hypothetical protein
MQVLGRDKTKRGKRGSRSKAPSCSGRGCLALVILRMYTAQPGVNAFHGDDPERLWGWVSSTCVLRKHDERSYTRNSSQSEPGCVIRLRSSDACRYVPAPVVEVRFGTRTKRLTGETVERYKVLPPCDPHKKTIAQLYLDHQVRPTLGDWSTCGDGAYARTMTVAMRSSATITTTT